MSRCTFWFAALCSSSLAVMLWTGCGPIPNPYSDAARTDTDAGRPDAYVPLADARPPAELTAVYAHSATELYRVDPDTLAVTLVAPFSFVGQAENITDIALDKNGTMIGISVRSVYSIDRGTGVVMKLADNTVSGFSSLSYVPDPANPAEAEILISANFDGDVYEIDSTTGQSSYRGSYGVDNTGRRIGSSGDIVSVRGFGTVATVNIEGEPNDFLAWINPGNFDASIIGDTGFDRIFGVGFWKGDVYGFTDGGEFLTIDVNRAAAAQVENAGAVRWWGAGVTTMAPIVD